MPSIEVAAHHFFLQIAQHIGYPAYKAISQRTWLAECVYAALLYPKKQAVAKKLFQREGRKNTVLQQIDFTELVTKIGGFTDSYIAALPSDDYLLAGFSISLCQLSASLYFIKKIKERFPLLPIVVGGASVAGRSGRDLQRAFSQIDFVVQGEGELPLAALLKELLDGSSASEVSKVKGLIVSQQCNRQDRQAGSWQLTHLKDLPSPDYDDYFKSLNDFSPHERFFPSLPVEASRGCWWKSKANDTETTGCAFCNLNLQWQGYRSKSAQGVVTQIAYLIRRYRVLSVFFTDNVLPPRIRADLFKALGELGVDLNIFAEIRAQTTNEMLSRMKRAGVSELQIGIEALSTSLLRRMNKGTRAIDNLQVIRDCAAQGIASVSNLLIQFPGSTSAEVRETLEALDFMQPFAPLKPVRFWLGLGSPVWRRPKLFGVQAVYNHPKYRYLFPDDLLKKITFSLQGYRGDQQYQRGLWRPVVKKIKRWQKDYTQMVQRRPLEPPLHFRDGKTFLVIIQRRPDNDSLNHRLTGQSRSIYLFCQKHRSLKRVLARFPTLSESNIRSFLKMMVANRLMFQENERFLSLAVPLQRRTSNS